jgi:hypothetical protein
MKSKLLISLVCILIIVPGVKFDYIGSAIKWYSPKAEAIFNNIVDLVTENLRAVGLFILTMVGVGVPAFVSKTGIGPKSTIPFLMNILPDRTESFYYRANIVLTLIVGSIIAFFILQPTEPRDAILSGFGWFTVINIKK